MEARDGFPGLFRLPVPSAMAIFFLAPGAMKPRTGVNACFSTEFYNATPNSRWNAARVVMELCVNRTCPTMGTNVPVAARENPGNRDGYGRAGTIAKTELTITPVKLRGSR